MVRKWGPLCSTNEIPPHEIFDLAAWGFGGRMCLRVIENVISLSVERESEPFVAVTSDLSVQGCRNDVSSPLGERL